MRAGVRRGPRRVDAFKVAARGPTLAEWKERARGPPVANGWKVTMANILVVEDDAAVRAVVERFLVQAGHTVSTAADGVEAMELLEVMPPDVVLTDVFMPEKDGMELILELGRQPVRPVLIAMSGGGLLGDLSMLEAAGKLGAVRTLPKPFGREELLAVVEDALVT